MNDKVEIRKRIITVAKSMFFENGYSAITTEELAHELGMSKRTLYEHYESKEKILEEVINEIETDINAKFEELVQLNLPFIEMLNTFYTMLQESLKFLKPGVVDNIRRFAPNVYSYLQEVRYKSVNSKLRILLQNGIDSGILRQDLDLNLIIPYFAYFFDKITSIDLINNNINPIEAIKTFILLAFEGMYSENFRKASKS